MKLPLPRNNIIAKALEHSDIPKTKEKLYSCSLCAFKPIEASYWRENLQLFAVYQILCICRRFKEACKSSHRRETLQLFAVSQIICTIRRFKNACKKSHRRETLQLFSVFKIICSCKRFEKACNNSQ